MATVSFEVKGLKELKKHLDDAVKMQAVKEVVTESTANLQRTMMRKASFKKGYHTGATKRSITLEMQQGGLAGCVKPNTEYAGYLEFGTRKMSAQPFVKPALEEVKPTFEKNLRKVMK